MDLCTGKVLGKALSGLWNLDTQVVTVWTVGWTIINFKTGKSSIGDITLEFWYSWWHSVVSWVDTGVNLTQARGFLSSLLSQASTAQPHHQGQREGKKVGWLSRKAFTLCVSLGLSTVFLLICQQYLTLWKQLKRKGTEVVQGCIALKLEIIAPTF